MRQRAARRRGPDDERAGRTASRAGDGAVHGVPAAILALQQSVGNRAVQRRLTGRAAPVVQAYRRFDKLLADKEIYAGQGKLIDEGAYHISVKRHLTRPRFFNEFHVTYDSLGAPDAHPHVYYSDQGVRLAKFDATAQNTAYKQQFAGKPTHTGWDAVLLDAGRAAEQFLTKRAPRLVARTDAELAAYEAEKQLEATARERGQTALTVLYRGPEAAWGKAVTPLERSDIERELAAAHPASEAPRFRKEAGKVNTYRFLLRYATFADARQARAAVRRITHVAGVDFTDDPFKAVAQATPAPADEPGL
ncbi:MAG: hypothetical protein KGS47_09635 [Chloroflexi bacterium]|nr:hypothetical protein [Chloroflexota bacterium]